MLKLQWLQINKFRSVKPGTRLVFNPAFNVLLGQNGTGKTTLLNLVAAVVSSDFHALRDEEFELEYELAANAGRIVASVRNVRSVGAELPLMPSQSVTVRFGENFESIAFLAELKVFAPDGALTFVVRYDGARVTVWAGSGASPPIAEVDYPKLEERLWLALMLGVVRWAGASRDGKQAHAVIADYIEFWNEVALKRFDEALAYFEQLKTTRLSLERSKASEVIQVSGSSVPDALVMELADLARLNWGAERYAFSAERVPFLSEMARLLGFESVEASIEIQQSGKVGDVETFELGELRFLLSRSGGSRISEQHLSYGQKRLLAFVYYRAMAHSVVVADELVNGLHHGWIRACIEGLESRQAFLTSQNPLLLDYLTFDSPEQVRSTFVLCKWDESTGQMLWEDMSPEAAEDFFESYKVGFQQVGELLRSKGLW